jgi:hypothetical protein
MHACFFLSFCITTLLYVCKSVALSVCLSVRLFIFDFCFFCLLVCLQCLSSWFVFFFFRTVCFVLSRQAPPLRLDSLPAMAPLVPLAPVVSPNGTVSLNGNALPLTALGKLQKAALKILSPTAASPASGEETLLLFIASCFARQF